MYYSQFFSPPDFLFLVAWQQPRYDGHQVQPHQGELKCRNITFIIIFQIWKQNLLSYFKFGNIKFTIINLFSVEENKFYVSLFSVEAFKTNLFSAWKTRYLKWLFILLLRHNLSYLRNYYSLNGPQCLGYLYELSECMHINCNLYYEVVRN